MKWFRLYAEAVDDSKLNLLAFEDRWHFIAICCLKCSGELEGKGDLRIRRIATKLGLSLAELDNVKKRLMEVELVDKEFNPVAWERRQFDSDRSAKRTRKYRETIKDMKRHSDVTVTVQETETETETDTDKKPRKSLSRFAAPSLTDVAEYCREKGFTIDPERFVDHYTANGWRVGNVSMKDWRAAARGWQKREIERGRHDRRSMIGADFEITP